MTDRKDTTGQGCEEILNDRGNNYGPAKEHFDCTVSMFNAWIERYSINHSLEDNTPEENMLFHVVYMICDKLARASHDATLVDNMKDIQGYAELWVKELEGESNTHTVGGDVVKLFKEDRA